MADAPDNNPEALLKETQPLLDEFAPHSYEQWKEAAESLLKGKPFDKLLITPTHEGFSLKPIYMQEDVADLPHMKAMPGLGNRVRGGQASGYLRDSWAISQEYTSPVPEDLRNWIVRELCLGVTEANIVCDQPTCKGLDPDKANGESVGICGTSLSTLNDLKTAFDGVYLEMCPVYFQSGMSGLPLLAGLVSEMRSRKLGLEYLKGCVEIDPLGYVQEHGDLPSSLDGAYDEMAAATKFAGASLPNMQTLHVSTQAYHKAGCTSSQEMAFALATAVDYTRAMQQRGIEAPDALARFRVSMAIGPQFFIEIAKFRAFRLLWAKIAEAFGAEEDNRNVHIHARTGQFNKSRLDAHSNMLRTCTEAFSAVIAGVDSLHVGWFDEVVREPDEFSRRTARNIQNVIKEECDMTRVIDMAGGSWAVESLTHQMAEEVWKHFQAIEKAGGMVKALEAGLPQEMCSASLAKKQKLFRQRRDILVGVNQYPSAIEKPLAPRQINYEAIANARQDRVAAARKGVDLEELSGGPDASVVEAIIQALESGSSFGDILSKLREGQASYSFTPVKQRRAAQDYEELIAACKKAEAAGQVPQIFQANIGASRRYRARADWTSAFFQAAGLSTLNEDDFDNAEAAAAKFTEAATPIAVITSDDRTYAEQAEAVAKALKAAKPDAFVILAGMLDEEMTAKVKEAGVDDFVHVRVNNYDFNRLLLEKLKVL